MILYVCDIYWWVHLCRGQRTSSGVLLCPSLSILAFDTVPLTDTGAYAFWLSQSQWALRTGLFSSHGAGITGTTGLAWFLCSRHFFTLGSHPNPCAEVCVSIALRCSFLTTFLNENGCSNLSLYPPRVNEVLIGPQVSRLLLFWLWCLYVCAYTHTHTHNSGTNILLVAIIEIKYEHIAAEEMAQQWRALAALPEDLSLIPHIQTASNNLL